MKKFFLFVLLQVMVLLYMVSSQYAVEWFGKELRLQTAPVDPKDLLYGEYVTLNYEISNIRADKFDQIPKPGDTVYVVLKKEGSYDQFDSAYLTKPSLSSDRSMIKGRVEYVSKQWDPMRQDTSAVESVHIVYGFERYYVPEGSGKELEEKRGQFDVIIKTSAFGQHLSSLSFIANGVMTQRDVQDLIYQQYQKQSISIDIVDSRLARNYENHKGPVWLVEFITFPPNTMKSPINRTLVVVDAKNGEIITEKKAEKIN